MQFGTDKKTSRYNDGINCRWGVSLAVNVYAHIYVITGLTEVKLRMFVHPSASPSILEGMYWRSMRVGLHECVVCNVT